MKIANFDLDQKVFIVAEIGNNHEGNFRLAAEMIELAAGCGADAVKFQTFQPELYVSTLTPKRLEQLRKFQLSYGQFKELSQFAGEKGLIFLTTPFDLESVDAIENFVPAYKVASADNNFFPLLEKIITKRKPILLSTGLTNTKDLEELVAFIRTKISNEKLSERLCLLHCVSAYPAPLESLNLKSIPFLAEHFDLTIGYSDHSGGILSSLGAVAVGARVIEKHFTYRQEDQSFRDHALSAEPKEFLEMVGQIRSLEKMMGERKKEVHPEEARLLRQVRRSIAARKTIAKGECIKEEDIIWVRPAVGFGIGEEKLVVGSFAKREIQKGEIIREEDLERRIYGPQVESSL